jgi:uncharacterized OB-fold protein
MSAKERPRPQATPLTQPFWDACERHELVAQRCSGCESFRHYPQPLCPACHSAEFRWEKLAGTGQIHSYSISHRAFHPAWEQHVPYVIATIELDEGIRMVCDMLDTDPGSVEIGQRVAVAFADMPGQGAMPRFKVVSA